jgi:CubicO group peptidase (beta-lactamase class C family)
MKQIFIILFILAGYFSYSQTVRKLDNLTMNEIDAVINAEISQSNLPGVSVGIIYNGRVAYTKAYGLAAPGVNATVSTKYPIASISKTITGILAMRMVQNGDFALDDRISDYVAGFSGITFRHLLSHQSGIGHYDNCGGGYSGSFNAANSILTVLGCTKCMTPPGSGTLYTTFGSTLLGAIIDIVGQTNYNKSYIQLYNDWIKTPGGLNDLTAEHDNLISGIAVGYSSANVAQTGYWNDIGWKLPAGGFVSTAHDLAEYGAGVMNYTFINSSRSSQMWTEQSTSGTPVNNCNDPLSSNYGLAFRVGGSSINRRITHNGLNSHGFSSLLYLFPDRKTGIALLTNRDDKTGALDDIRQALENTLLCAANREFTSNINWTDNWIYEANSIKASNTFSANVGEIIFDGATDVVFKPGFHAQAGIVFRAVSDGCYASIDPY